MQSLKWSVISFTEKGAELAEKIKRLSKEQQLPSEIHTYHGRKRIPSIWIVTVWVTNSEYLVMAPMK